MANYFHMARIAMLCAERNIRAYTRVEGDTQTVRLGIFSAEPEHYVRPSKQASTSWLFFLPFKCHISAYLGFRRCS